MRLGQVVQKAAFRSEVERLIEAGLLSAAEAQDALAALQLRSVLQQSVVVP
jgi:hypothetical protein